MSRGTGASPDAVLSFRNAKVGLGAAPTVEARDLQGNYLGSAAVSIPNAQVIGVNAFSRSAGGSFVASGWARSADGKSACFIAQASDGHTQHVIRTSPYCVEKLVVAADGTIWTVGNVLNREGEPTDNDPKGGTVRHFDRSGKLLESYFPYASLDDQIRVMMGFLAASHDRVGWLSTGDQQTGKGRSGAYVEFTAGGVQEYPLPPLAPVAGGVLFGLATTDRGDVFASVLADERSSQILSLDRSTHSWTPVSLPGLPSDAFLSGANGGNVIAAYTLSTANVFFYGSTK